MKKAKIIKGKKPKANDDYAGFKDELTLAQLIQNAAARGLHSVRGGLFGRPFTEEELDDDYGWADDLDTTDNTGEIGILKINLRASEIVPAQLRKPPNGATCACALGAQLMTPKVDNPVGLSAPDGNDPEDGQLCYWADDRSANIGMAYEQALRPD